MNKPRRKSLAKALEQLRIALEAIQSIRDDEQEAYDNMPESLQMGARGETMNEGLDLLNNEADTIENAISELEGLV